MNEPREVSDFLELGEVLPAADIMKESVKALRGYMEHGEIKLLAKRHGVNLRRAYHLLQGKRKITDADEKFIMACYDKALPRKVKRFDKLKRLL